MFQKRLPTILFALFAIFFVADTADAKPRNWTWSRYRIGWTVPGYMAVKENNAVTFRMSNADWHKRRTRFDFDFRVTPWKNSRATAVGVASYSLRSWTWQRPITRNQYRARLAPWQIRQGLSAYVIWGRGIQRGRTNYYAVIGFIHRRSPVNFYVRAVWSGNARNAGVALVNQLVRSFRRTY